MYDKAEHRVACFRAAQELRRQGKPTWVTTLRIKHLLSDDPITDDKAIALGKQIAEAIKRNRFFQRKGWLDIESDHFDFELDDIIENLEDVDPEDSYWASNEDQINALLNQLYDWADARRVWIG